MVSRFSFIDGSLFLHFVSVCFFPFQFSLLFVFISHCINDSFYIVLCQACGTLCHNVLKVVEIFIWSEASPCPLIYHWVWGSCENMVFTKMFVYVFFYFSVIGFSFFGIFSLWLMSCHVKIISHHAIMFWISLKLFYETRFHRVLWFIVVTVLFFFVSTFLAVCFHIPMYHST